MKMKTALRYSPAKILLKQNLGGQALFTRQNFAQAKLRRASATRYTLHATRSSGFTLIELLIAIVIISLLVSVVLVNMNTSRIKSRNAKRMSDLTTIQFALEQYYDDALCTGQGCYPLCKLAGSDVFCNSTETDWTDNIQIKTASYLPNMPKDPTNNIANDYVYYYVRGYRKVDDITYRCVNSGGALGCLMGNPATDYILAARIETYTGGPTYQTLVPFVHVNGNTTPIGLATPPYVLNILLGNQ